MITLPNITESPWRREEHYVGIDLAGPYALTEGATYRVRLTLRSDGRVSVRTSPPLPGLAARKFAVVSFITIPARAALVRSSRPWPTSSASHGVVPFSFVPPVKAVIMSADFTSAGVQDGCTARTRVAAPAAWGLDIEVPLMLA